MILTIQECKALSDLARGWAESNRSAAAVRVELKRLRDAKAGRLPTTLTSTLQKAVGHYDTMTRNPFDADVWMMANQRGQNLPVETRDGEPARILAYEPTARSVFKVVVFTGETIALANVSGVAAGFDLFFSAETPAGRECGRHTSAERADVPTLAPLAL